VYPSIVTEGHEFVAKRLRTLEVGSSCVAVGVWIHHR